MTRPVSCLAHHCRRLLATAAILLLPTSARAAIEGSWEVTGSVSAAYSARVGGGLVAMPALGLPYTDTISFGPGGDFQSGYGSGTWARMRDGSYRLAYALPELKTTLTALLHTYLPDLTAVTVVDAFGRVTNPAADTLAGRSTFTMAVRGMAGGSPARGTLVWTVRYSSTVTIPGLTYVDYSLTWDRWDSDPLFDGVRISPSYFTSVGDWIPFAHKPHTVRFDFYTQKPPDTGWYPQPDALFFTQEVTVASSEDRPQIPVELYQQALVDAGYDLESDVLAFVIMTVQPPLGVPLAELVVGYPDQLVWRPILSPWTPNP
jgi:hypothetical protein